MANKFLTEYGVLFEDKHSFRDFGMYPKSKMIVDPPSVRESYVEIAGADGDLDLSQVLTGHVSYASRSGKFEFTVIDREKWDYTYSLVMNTIHGQRMRVVLDEDRYYYYEGRLHVDSFKTNKRTGTIVVGGHFNPYKKSLIANSEQWLWDPFNFETDVARDYANMTVSGTTTMTIVGGNMPTSPVFKTSSAMTLRYNGKNYPLTQGNNRIAGLTIGSGEHEMTFTGNGTVSVQFEIGSL